MGNSGSQSNNEIDEEPITEVTRFLQLSNSVLYKVTTECVIDMNIKMNEMLIIWL